MPVAELGDVRSFFEWHLRQIPGATDSAVRKRMLDFDGGVFLGDTINQMRHRRTAWVDTSLAVTVWRKPLSLQVFPDRVQIFSDGAGGDGRVSFSAQLEFFNGQRFDAASLAPPYNLSWKPQFVNGGAVVGSSALLGTHTIQAELKTLDGVVAGTAVLTVVTRPGAKTTAASPGTIEFTQPFFEAAEEDGLVALQLHRYTGDGGPVAVTFSTGDGTAVAPADYTSTSDTASWPDGSSGTTLITIPLRDDDLADDGETFFVRLAGPVGGATLGSLDTATVVIRDHDRKAEDPELAEFSCRYLELTPLVPSLRQGETTTIRTVAVMSDGSRQDVTQSPLLSWKNGLGPEVRAPEQIRADAQIELVATIADNSCSGRTTLLLMAASWQQPISNADDSQARALPVPGDASRWHVVCNKESDPCSVAYTQHLDLTRHTAMSPPLPGPRTAAQWIDNNCPSLRCTADGQCSTAPVRGGDWRVVCNTADGTVTLSHDRPSGFDRKILEDSFCGEPDARWWVNLNCPSWLCDATGNCASEPSTVSPAIGDSYVQCYLPTGHVEIGRRASDPTKYRAIAGPFNGPKTARWWVEQNCPDGRCDASGCLVAGSPVPPDGDRDSGSGFAERGQSEGTAEELRGDFVAADSTEARKLLNEAQRAYIESQINGRGFNKQSVDRMVNDILAEYQRQNPVPDMSQDISRAFKDMVDTVVLATTGTLPGGGGVSPSGHMSSEDGTDGSGAGRTEQTWPCWVYSCWESKDTWLWKHDDTVHRRHYSCGTMDVVSKVCEPFCRGEKLTKAGCERELARCQAVARQLDFVEDQKGGH